MSKELINEIESKIAWNDMNINETSISLGDVKRLLNELDEQAERVEELEKERDEWKNTAQTYYVTNQELREQNKRYRKWAERNKQMIDFSRFEKGDLGPEPDWVEEKRRADYRKKVYVPKPHNTPWSSREDNLLKHMVEKGYTYPEICDQLQRTHGAVKRRLLDLGIKYRPVYLDNHRPYTQKEIDYILESLKKGISIQEIARHLKRSEAGVRGKLERMGYKFRNGVPYIIGEKQIS